MPEIYQIENDPLGREFSDKENAKTVARAEDITNEDGDIVIETLIDEETLAPGLRPVSPMVGAAFRLPPETHTIELDGLDITDTVIVYYSIPSAPGQTVVLKDEDGNVLAENVIEALLP